MVQICPSAMVCLGARAQGLGLCLGQALPLRGLIVQVCKEMHRFEKLMEYFRNEDSNIDFMVRSLPGPAGGVVPERGARLAAGF